MRGWSAVLVAIGGLLVTHGARAQQGAEQAAAPSTALPPLPTTTPAPLVVMQPPPGSPATMVTVTAPGATVDCGRVRVELQCPRMELTEPTMARKPRTSWYGWQTLISDGAALALLVGAGGSKNNSGALLAASGLTYTFGGPIVHWAHGNGGRGAVSLGLRVGAPIGLGLLGFAVGSALDSGRSENYGGIVFGALGFVIGIPTAIAIDAAVIAREPVEDEPEVQAKVQPPPQRAAFTVAPDVKTTRTGAQLGLRGTF
jgi:hypothetical protein